jgi:hypothetical protein
MRKRRTTQPRFRRRAQARFPGEVRRQSLDAIYAGKPFKTAIRDFGLTSNQLWGLTKTDVEWATALDAALTARRRDDLKHGTNASYVSGWDAQPAKRDSAANCASNCWVFRHFARPGC